jgi:mannose-6-phosphate isomerase class I
VTGQARGYMANPWYPPVGGIVGSSWPSLAGSIGRGTKVLAIDGPAIAHWEQLERGLANALGAQGRRARFVSTSKWALPWAQVKQLTSSLELAGDPDFDKLAGGTLAELFRLPRRTEAPEATLLVVYGPGAALFAHDTLWYADLPKRYAEAAVNNGEGRNVCQPHGEGSPTTKRLFFIDWPLLDRHRDQVVGQIDCWVDMQSPESPAFLDGKSTRATLAHLARRPFRTRPTFNTTPWGGHWAQRELGHGLDAANTALGYELIAPEAGVLVGQQGGPFVELPFQLVVSANPAAVLGRPVQSAFGTSFPVRFDYLDTYGGGNLSVHCHPRQDYMRSVFGWPYTQHESYYVMVGTHAQEIFLGLRDGVDVDTFYNEVKEADQNGTPVDISKYVPSFPAEQHQLFLIPAGTPHGSGAGNVVLEVSATPYLYSLRFYDWLRRGAGGELRPVHVDHAFANLDATRTARAVKRDLVQKPRVLREGQGWREEMLGALSEMFFEVRRVVLAPGAVARQDSSRSFHVLNVVAGQGAALEPECAPAHEVVYAETIVVPSAVGSYRLRALGDRPVYVVKALVPPSRAKP